MPNIIGKIPEFTTDDSVLPKEENESEGEKGEEEVKEAGADEVPEEEKETPSELPAEEEPAGEKVPDDDAENLKRANQALQEEKQKLLNEIVNLRGQRREVKQEKLVEVQKQIDDLKDLHPQDVNLIDRVLRAKGYITKEEQQKAYYKSVQDEELSKFLAKYPEFKPENDPNDLNWSALLRELNYYRAPDNPHSYGEVLERARRGIVKVSGERGADEAAKRKLSVASVGKGGSQRSSSSPSEIGNKVRKAFASGQMIGWSEEEIKELE